RKVSATSHLFTPNSTIAAPRVINEAIISPLPHCPGDIHPCPSSIRAIIPKFVGLKMCFEEVRSKNFELMVRNPANAIHSQLFTFSKRQSPSALIKALFQEPFGSFKR